MTADNPAARVDLDAHLSEAEEHALCEAMEAWADSPATFDSVGPYAVVERIIADRLAPLLAERDHWKSHAEEAGRGFERVCRDYARVSAARTTAEAERGRDGLREKRCAFCPIIEGDAPANIIERGERHIAFVPLGPHVPGHVLFVPTEHLPDATTNPERAGSVLAEAARYVAEQGIEANIITSVGPAATQSVPHLHVHVIPRGADDGLPARWPWIPEPQCTCGDAFAANQWWHLPDCPRHPLDRRILAEHPATGDEERGCRECGPGCLGHTAPPASDVDSDNAAAGGAEGLAEVLCLCHETVCPIHNEAAGLTAEYDVQSLMNALAAHVAQAKAEALREAADAIWQREGGYTGGVQWGRADYAGWLRDRADRIAGGGA